MGDRVGGTGCPSFLHPPPPTGLHSSQEAQAQTHLPSHKLYTRFQGRIREVWMVEKQASKLVQTHTPPNKLSKESTLL